MSQQTVPFLLIAPLQIMKDCSQVTLEPSLLQVEQPQLSQPLHAGKVFHFLDHFCGPLPDVVQQVHVSPVLRGPHVDTVLQMMSTLRQSLLTVKKNCRENMP